MKNLFIILLLCFSFSAFCQPDTINFEAGKLWIGLKEPLPEVSLTKFKSKLKVNEKDKELKELKSIKKVFKSDDPTLGKIYEVGFTKGKDLKKYLKKYANNFEYVEYIPKPTLDSYYTPSDYGNPTGNVMWHIDHLGLRIAWQMLHDVGVTNQTKLAIIDAGFDGDHEDLIDNIAYMHPRADNNHHHGTAVAGIAAMSTNNGNIGYCSVAGQFSDIYAYPYWYQKADNIRDAADRGCRVINMSYGYGSTPNETVRSAINYAYSKGVLLVASAGNDTTSAGLYLTTIQYPACYDYVTAVAALNLSDVKRKNSRYYPQVDISAPGTKITSTDSSNTYYHTASATSAAAPIVSGTASLLFAYNPRFSPYDVEQILKTSANSDILSLPGNLNFEGKMGTGIVSPVNALSCAIELKQTKVINNLLQGTINSYSLEINNSTPTGNVNLITNELKINGTFHMSTGKTLSIKPEFVINCK